jgi:hypothetical protein
MMPPRFFRRRAVWLLAAAGAALGGLAALLFYQYQPRDNAPLPPRLEEPQEATSEDIHSFCAACHAFPPPDTFPRSSWRDEVARGYHFFETARATQPALARLQAPLFESVARYYEKRAPETLPPLAPEVAPGPVPVRWRSTGLPWAHPSAPASIAHVNLVHLGDDRKLDVLACDMRGGQVAVLKPYAPSPSWRVLGDVPHPAHAEVVDLDGDGIKDIVVADLGSFTPTDERVGSVVLLKGTPGGSYLARTLLRDVGRVCDVQAADFNNDGKTDLIVAVFGLHTSGSILYLENRTTDWSQPVFVPHVVDSRQGAIHVPVAYLQGDKKRPDFVALISQEHETVVAFLNEGGGRFRKETIYAAPHPAFGSTGIQLVDLDGDGRQDVLLTNGDVLDPPFLLKPYHGIHWLENRGTFPFVAHHLTAMHGVHRAVAADFLGKGKKDIVAVSFLPAEYFPEARERRLHAVIYLEQTAPGRFVRHVLETGTCAHATCAAGTWDGDGRVHLVTGNFTSPGYTAEHAVTLWKNLGP